MSEESVEYLAKKLGDVYEELAAKDARIKELETTIEELQKERFRKPNHECPSCGFDFSNWHCVCRERIDSLTQKLEAEHENFLAVHRDNMKIFDFNMSLTQKLAKAREILQSALIENQTGIGSDEYWDGVAYACRTIRPKIKEALKEIGE